MSKVVLSGYISVPESDLLPVKAALPEHIRLTRAESGYLVFTVTECPTKFNRFEVYEEFADEAAFRYHQERVTASPWSTYAKSVERHFQIEGLND